MPLAITVAYIAAQWVCRRPQPLRWSCCIATRSSAGTISGLPFWFQISDALDWSAYCVCSQVFYHLLLDLTQIYTFVADRLILNVFEYLILGIYLFLAVVKRYRLLRLVHQLMWSQAFAKEGMKISELEFSWHLQLKSITKHMMSRHPNALLHTQLELK